jgi:hypothetical protein
MKIYLCGPMMGIADDNRPLFAKVAAILREQGHEVFNPAELEENTTRNFFTIELTWICQHAEAICMLPGWERSKGAIAEKAVAARLNLKTMFFDVDKVAFVDLEVDTI